MIKKRMCSNEQVKKDKYKEQRDRRRERERVIWPPFCFSRAVKKYSHAQSEHGANVGDILQLKQQRKSNLIINQTTEMIMNVMRMIFG